MTSEWGQTLLGDHLARVRRMVSLQDGVEYAAVSVTKDGQGLGPKESFVGGVTNYETLYRVEKDDVVLRTITAFESPVAVAQSSHAGSHVSGVFLTYEVAPSMLPGYLRLFFQSQRFWREMQLRAKGTVLRRKTINDASFKAIPLPTPSPAEQRRIVDVMAAVDAQIEATREELERAREMLLRLNSELATTLPDSRALGEFTSTRSGPSYAATDVSPTPGPGSVPVIGIPNTKPDGSIDLTDIGYVVGLPRSVGRIDESSLVLIRTNGNRQRIGNVYLPPASAHGYAVSAFQFLMKVDDPSDREFVYWVLREPSGQAAMSDAASGTTGLGNLAVSWLNALEIPWSNDPAERAAVVEPLRSLSDSIDASRNELSRLRIVRSDLLSGLLSQEIEIPDSYDRLLEEVS